MPLHFMLSHYPSVSAVILLLPPFLMSPNTVPYFSSSNPYIVSSMNRNYCAHPYSHIPQANGLEPQKKKVSVYLEFSYTVKHL